MSERQQSDLSNVLKEGADDPAALDGVIRAAASIAAERLKLEKRAEEAETRAAKEKYRADHDELTGLLNKAAWNRELEKRIEQGGDGSFGVVYIDLKDFKKINDTQGHEAGDKVLKGTAEVIKSVASVLTENLRTEGNHADIIANEPQYTSDKKEGRLGGDEFAVLLNLTPRSDSSSRLTPEDRLTIVNERITKAFHAHPEIADSGVGISLGGAVWQEGMGTSELLEQADAAMRDHKQAQIREIGAYRPLKPEA